MHKSGLVSKEVQQVTLPFKEETMNIFAKGNGG